MGSEQAELSDESGLHYVYVFDDVAAVVAQGKLQDPEGYEENVDRRMLRERREGMKSRYGKVL